MTQRLLAFLLGFALMWGMGSCAHAQTGNVDTKTQLNTDINTNWPDNTTGAITPAIARQTLLNAVSSYQIAARVNAQVGVSYTILLDDFGKLVTFSNANPVAVTLPQATGALANFNVYMCNLGAGSVTITPQTSTIGGAGSLGLVTNQCVQAISDGTNYQIFPGPPPATSSFTQPAFNNCGLSASVATNILTVNLTDSAGNPPSAGSKCQINFRHSTSNNGTLVSDTVSAALSITTFATGASLGSSNNTAFRFWVVAFDNGGAVVLALYNASTFTAVTAAQCLPINEDQVQTSVAMTAGSTSAGVYYTPNGTTLTGKSIRILGYVEYNSTGLATAGTYATGPNFINVMGSGSKRPCDPLQRLYSVNAGITNASGASFIDTGTLKAITLSSAANLVQVDISAVLDATVATTTAEAVMARGAGGGTQIGTRCDSTNSGGALLSQCVMTALDKPNTVASITYVARIASSDGIASDAVWNATAIRGTIILQEIMG